MQRQETWQDSTGEQLANGLGWFSIGLGLAEVLAPSAVANLIGVADTTKTRGLLRFYGMRELAAGVGILMQPRPAGWLWGRVAGDLVDLASLTAALNDEESDRNKVGAATAAVAAVTALDIYCAQRLTEGGVSGLMGSGTTSVHATARINKPPEEVYRFWRNFENLPSFMYYLESVQTIGDGRSRWKAKAPAGMTAEWEAEITEDRAGEMIAWRSLEGADVYNAGSVRFEAAPGGRGTDVHVELEYAPPGGKVTALAAKLFGMAPEQQIDTDLRRFKQLLEVGEVVMSDSSIHKGMHPAQPSERTTEEQ